ncbi:MAG: undecaprenyldiphospho-muramoylpentapeptide beta-N-acetylglucosaminyltransferase [Deltaproteobacteria bacterium]|jgi:UDP-N-acetylglucosamine--N-acetylmuramyl-(pentapeptide) pyrophosphoryl-undecaprenol N-acetylglucosamine transferase|nr:undecaprenyldiphospho-muramoylpentapeptide beta-N-acetylglucosaminyltransferase [Deltaproteobacteria bacterium]
MRKDLKFLIAAGGTGGHVMPAATVANEIKELCPEADFLFIGVGRPAEKDILDPLGFKRKDLNVVPLAGRSPIKAIIGLFKLFRSLIGAVSIIREYRPDICLAFGGYVCGPVGLASKIFGLPLVLHEQNSKVGLANRWLGYLADLVMLGFREAEDGFKKSKRVVFVGNPIRKEISSLAESERVIDNVSPLLLVIGGSQGSRRLNQAVMEMAENIVRKKITFRIIHQTGSEMEKEVATFYQQIGLKAEVKAFISDMAEAYKSADLAVTRAGALTLAELLAAKLPAVLVPLPTAAGDHQTMNAQAVSNLGLARMVQESEISQGGLERTVFELLEQPGRLQQMSDSAVNKAHDSGKVGPTMAKLVLEVLENFQKF